MAVVFLLVLLVGAPLAELYVLIEVSAWIGAAATIALCLATAALGAFLVRLEGIAVLLRAREALAREALPALELLEGALLLAAGAMLLVPGFITDAAGFLLLVPGLRRRLVLGCARRRRRREGPPAPRRGRIIEGEHRRMDAGPE